MTVFDPGADRLIAAVHICRLLADVDGFLSFMRDRYPGVTVDSVHRGHQFGLDVATRLLHEAIALDLSLGLPVDALLLRADSKGRPLHELPPTTARVRMLKALRSQVRPLLKTASWVDYAAQATQLRGYLERVEQRLLKGAGRPRAFGASKVEAARAITMWTTNLRMNQAHHGRPDGYYQPLLKNEVGPDHNGNVLRGYSYALESLWSRLLGEAFDGSVCATLHTATVWVEDPGWPDWLEMPSGATGIDWEEDADGSAQGPGRQAPGPREPTAPARTGEEVSFDAFFDRIQEEIVRPLERRFGRALRTNRLLPMRRSIRNPFNEWGAMRFQEPALSHEQRWAQLLYWYPIEIIDATDYRIFNGPLAFEALLTGLIEMKRRAAPGDRVRVLRLAHPTAEGDHLLSYGVLIDVVGLISDLSGWIVLWNCSHDCPWEPDPFLRRIEETLSGLLATGEIEEPVQIVAEGPRFLDRMKAHVSSGLKDPKYANALEQLIVSRNTLASARSPSTRTRLSN